MHVSKQNAGRGVKKKVTLYVKGVSPSNLNMNLYATKKTAAEGMLDIALFLANITHMKTVIEQGAGYSKVRGQAHY
ncbi:Ninjurin-1 [Liparis tanakae]|uniref:Ninjurin-1 n=1 Tax=Liparis tanakae TaxID=230148 RepID=A0A4Z2GIW0_9TELE|nr:Ninjurin-1 [Liparis tanakae]